VFQVRFKAIVVHKQSYLLELAVMWRSIPCRRACVSRQKTGCVAVITPRRGEKRTNTALVAHRQTDCGRSLRRVQMDPKAHAAYRNHVRAGVELSSI
jgi:hypothetical protein